MAKEVAIEKRAKISQAQQYMLLAVLGAAIFLGAAVSLILHFISQISFNMQVIAEEEKAIVAYSNAIRDIGVCKKPKGSIYTDDELKKCNPDSIDVSLVPGTLRANIMENMAANAALNSVPKEDSSCTNPYTGKKYSYDELNKMYTDAETDDDLIAASELIQKCSALRIIPDALPGVKNEEALLSSLNKIFILTDIEPEMLTPTGSTSVSSIGKNLQTISIQLSVESSTENTVKFLENVERSIREFNIDHATIEWGSDNTLVLQAQAEAFYMLPSELTETKQTVKVQKGGK